MQTTKMLRPTDRQVIAAKISCAVTACLLLTLGIINIVVLLGNPDCLTIRSPHIRILSWWEGICGVIQTILGAIDIILIPIIWKCSCGKWVSLIYLISTNVSSIVLLIIGFIDILDQNVCMMLSYPVWATSFAPLIISTALIFSNGIVIVVFTMPQKITSPNTAITQPV